VGHVISYLNPDTSGGRQRRAPERCSLRQRRAPERCSLVRCARAARAPRPVWT